MRPPIPQRRTQRPSQKDRANEEGRCLTVGTTPSAFQNALKNALFRASIWLPTHGVVRIRSRTEGYADLLIKHMTSSVENGLKRWKVLFIILDAVVLIPLLSTVFFPSPNHRGSQFSGWQLVLVVVYLVSWLSLLIGSPFFLRSLRGVALSGWIIAFGILLYAVLNPRL